LYTIGSTTSFDDPLTSLTDNDGRPEMTSLAASSDDVLLLAPSSDVHDIAVIVQLTHGNIISLWTQLRYAAQIIIIIIILKKISKKFSQQIVKRSRCFRSV